MHAPRSSEDSPARAPRLAVLYDGQCVFCTRQMDRLVRLGGPHRLEPLDFHAPGVLERFAPLTFDDCMKQMWVVHPDGRRWGGMEAAVRAFMTRPLFGWIALGYYIPGIRQLLDAIYRRIAARRYEIAGRDIDSGGCDGGTCKLHFPPPDDDEDEPSDDAEEEP